MKKSHYIRIISIFILMLLFASATPPVWAKMKQVITKQIITNGGFETDVSGWDVNDGVLSHTTTVVHTGDGSGQLDLVNNLEGGYVGNFSQCIDLSGDLVDWPPLGTDNYITVSGMFKTNAGSGSDAFFLTQFWANINCSSHVSDTFSAGVANQDWTEERYTLAIPADAQSVQIWVFAGGETSSPVYIDELRAFSSTPTAVSMQHIGVKQPVPLAGVIVVILLVMTMVVWRKRPFS